jgi:outer membrane immunogenic protein
MKRLILGVAAALMLSAGQAAADGLPDRGGVRDHDGPIGGAWNWTGFYVGAGIGGGVLEVESDVASGDGEGFLGTVVFGYDRQFAPGWVVGVFVDVDFTDFSADVNGDSVDQTYAWSVGGRLGGLITPKSLLYATGGYTQAEFEGALDGTADGYFVGAGFEHMLHHNWTLKLEYRYTELQAGVVDQVGNDAGDADFSSHTGRLVLTYKFGGPRY